MQVLFLLGRLAYIISRILLRLILGQKRRNLFYKDIIERFKTKRFKSSLFYFLEMKHCVAVGGYESEASRVLKRLRGKIFVDIGANIGYYSFLLHDNFEKIYAFEPLSKPFNLLCWYIRAFKAKNIIPIQKAVSDRDGQEEFILVEGTDFISSLDQGQMIASLDRRVGDDFQVLPFLPRVKVEVVTLSSLFPDIEIDCVKLDVEGNEWKVLSGALPIMKNIKRWFIELHNLDRKTELELFLTMRGYSIKWFNLNKPCPHVYAERRVMKKV